MRKIMLLFGTRPEAIKMCPLANELKKRKSLEATVCVTGQHTRMLYDALRDFSVEPDCDLSVMRSGQTLSSLTAGLIAGVEKAIAAFAPEVVVVHGDTATALAGALAGFFSGIPVAHVEAGLRTYDIRAPFPEEFNRRAVSLVSEYNFAPTEGARENLLREGVSPDRIWVTGNTVIDALNFTVRENYSHPELKWARGGRLVFLTAHRRENIGAPMRGMLRAIRRVLREHPDTKAVYPLHMNPQVREIALEELGGCGQIHMIEPLGVIDCHNIMTRCYLLLTDSGGIQEEAAALGKPTLIMRESTERPEGVASGVLRAAGTSEQSVYENFKRLLDDREEYSMMARACSSYGDGRACERIADILEGVSAAK